jgi:hypothetical protein
MNYETCYNTENKLGNNVPRTNGYYCDNGIDGGEFIPSEGVYRMDLSNYNVYYGKEINGTLLTGTYTSSGLTFTLSSEGRVNGQTLTLEQAKKFCDGLGTRCAAFTLTLKNRKNLQGISTFYSRLDDNTADPDAYSKKENKTLTSGYTISYVKKDTTKDTSATPDDSRIQSVLTKYKNQPTCNWKNTTKCILKDYTSNGNALCSTGNGNGNPDYVISNYNSNQLNDWLRALYNRDLGKDKCKGEAANIYEYYERCKSVPGYEFLQALNLTDPYPKLESKADISGRYVRISTNNVGDNAWLQLAEVSVIKGCQNIAQGKPSKAKTVYQGVASPSRANDGNTDGNYNNGSVYHSGHTDGRGRGPEYWEVDLEVEESIERIIVYNRTDCCGGRMIDWLVTIYDGSRKLVWASIYPVPPNPKTTIEPRKSNNDISNPLIKDYEANKFNEYFTRVKGDNKTNRYVAKVGWEGHCAEQCHKDICENAGKKWIGNNNWYACEDNSDVELFKKINSWLPGGNKIGNLLYKASRDGWSPEKFHELCDSAFGTITIARLTDGRVLGGYNPEDWSGNQTKNPDDVFLFDNNEKYSPGLTLLSAGHFGLFPQPNNYPIFGGIFGGGYDFYIDPRTKILMNKPQTFVSRSGKGPLGNRHRYMSIHDINDLEVYACEYNDEDELFKKINKWLLGSKIDKLLYKARRDGWSPQKFHQLCDSAYGTVTIARLKNGRVVGGYYPGRWGDIDDESHLHAFLFDNNKKYPFKHYGFGTNGADIKRPSEPEQYPKFLEDLIIGYKSLKLFPSSYTDFINERHKGPLGNYTKYNNNNRRWEGGQYYDINDLEVYAVEQNRYWKVHWSDVEGSVDFPVNLAADWNIAFHFNIRKHITVMNSLLVRTGHREWQREIYSDKFHNRPRPITFFIKFNAKNGFEVIMDGNVIANFPNRFNLSFNKILKLPYWQIQSSNSYRIKVTDATEDDFRLLIHNK